MISWYSIKEAAVSLAPIPFNGDSPKPFSPEDDTTLRKAIKLVYNASGSPTDDATVNKELSYIVNRAKPYKILDDGNTVGIGVISHFNHHDPKTKKQYDGQSLDDLAVFPEYQNKGIGREAIKLFVEEMMKDRPKWLHIAHDNSNDRAAHLYTSLGFGKPVPWNDKATSLHMSVFDAKRKLKEWAKERKLKSKTAADSIEQLATDFAYGPKWHDEDTNREYLSHMNEYETEGTPKNLVDAAIIQRIKASIAKRRAKELIAQYNRVTGGSYKDILASRLAKFRSYEHIPFPKK